MAETNKSQLMSEAEIIEAINADSLISVSLGAGQPQKNVKMSTLASVAAELIGNASSANKGLLSVSNYLKLQNLHQKETIAFMNNGEYTTRTIPNGIAMFKFERGQSHLEVFALGDSSVVRLSSSVAGEYIKLTRSGTTTTIACGGSMSFSSKNELTYSYIPLSV